MKKTTKHTIWQDYEINVEDYSDFFEEEMLDEYEKYEICCEMNAMYLEDERCNLNIDVANGIICIGDLGLWNGRRCAYIDSDYHNISECLVNHCNSMCYTEFYVDAYDFCQRESHHDGTNYYVYRAWKDGVTEEQKDAFKCALFNGDVTKISWMKQKYTRSLRKDIAKVYGF